MASHFEHAFSPRPRKLWNEHFYTVLYSQATISGALLSEVSLHWEFHTLSILCICKAHISIFRESALLHCMVHTSCSLSCFFASTCWQMNSCSLYLSHTALFSISNFSTCLLLHVINVNNSCFEAMQVLYPYICLCLFVISYNSWGLCNLNAVSLMTTLPFSSLEGANPPLVSFLSGGCVVVHTSTAPRV